MALDFSRNLILAKFSENKVIVMLFGNVPGCISHKINAEDTPRVFKSIRQAPDKRPKISTPKTGYNEHIHLHWPDKNSYLQLGDSYA